MSRQRIQFGLPKALQAVPLLLLSVLLLVAQLPTLMTTHTPTPMLAMHGHAMQCVTTSEVDCHAQSLSECCDTQSDCVFDCAQGAAWINTVSIPPALAVVRALPPPIEQRWSDQPIERPYQPPRSVV